MKQVLGAHIQAVASNYTGTNASAYQAAAKTLRTPVSVAAPVIPVIPVPPLHGTFVWGTP